MLLMRLHIFHVFFKETTRVLRLHLWDMEDPTYSTVVNATAINNKQA